MVRSSFLVALQIVYCKPATSMKSGLLDFSEHTMDFLTEFQNTEVSVTLLKSDSTTDTLTAIFIILETNKQTKEAFEAESAFGIVING